MDITQVHSLFSFDSNGKVTRNSAEETQEAWLELEEAVAMTDDDLLTEYLDTSSLSTEQVIQGLRNGIRDHKLLPLVYTSAEKNLGIYELMDTIAAFLPNPVEAREDALTAACESEQGKCGMKPGVEAGFAARVIHTTVDSFGSLSILRVISNALGKDGKFDSIPHNVVNLRTRDTIKIGLTAFLLQGKDRVPMQTAHVLPGNVIAVPKLPDSVQTNDILTVPEAVSEEVAEIIIEESSHVLTPLSRATKEMPLMFCASVGLPDAKNGKKGKGNGNVNTGDDKLISALDAISREDLAVRLEQSGGNLLLHCMSSDHANLVAARVKDRYGIEIELDTPPVQYKETIRKTVTSVEGRHKKQSGGSEYSVSV
jgi:elongation factor G